MCQHDSCTASKPASHHERSWPHPSQPLATPRPPLPPQDMPFFDTRASTADLLHSLREDTHTYQARLRSALLGSVVDVACTAVLLHPPS